MEDMQKIIENRILDYKVEKEEAEKEINSLGEWFSNLPKEIKDYVIPEAPVPEVPIIRVTKYLSHNALGGVTFPGQKESKKILIINGATGNQTPVGSEFFTVSSEIAETEKGLKVDKFYLYPTDESLEAVPYLKIDNSGLRITATAKVKGMYDLSEETLASWADVPLLKGENTRLIIEPGKRLGDILERRIKFLIETMTNPSIYEELIKRQELLLERLERVGYKLITVSEDDGEFGIGGHYRGMYKSNGQERRHYLVPTDITNEEILKISKNSYVNRDLWVQSYSARDELSCPIDPKIPGLEEYDIDYTYGTYEGWMELAEFKRALERRDIEYIKAHPPKYDDRRKLEMIKDIWGESPIEGLRKWKEKERRLEEWVKSL